MDRIRWLFNTLYFQLFGRHSKWRADLCELDQYVYMGDDDRIDIKNYSRIGDRQRRRMLRRRMGWYVRHGYFDLAEDIDTAFWAAKQVRI